MTEAEQIAQRLTPGQRSTVRLLGDAFSVLGCSEPWAIRLCADMRTRPALVREGPRSADGYRTFALTDLGAAVRPYIPEARGQ